MNTRSHALTLCRIFFVNSCPFTGHTPLFQKAALNTNGPKKHNNKTFVDVTSCMSNLYGPTLAAWSRSLFVKSTERKHGRKEKDMNWPGKKLSRHLVTMHFVYGQTTIMSQLDLPLRWRCPGIQPWSHGGAGPRHVSSSLAWEPWRSFCVLNIVKKTNGFNFYQHGRIT